LLSGSRCAVAGSPPDQRERRTDLHLRFFYRRRGPSLLVPQVKLRERLDLARDADRALDSVARLIVANWVVGRLCCQCCGNLWASEA
jgi:hypothetical protein